MLTVAGKEGDRVTFANAPSTSLPVFQDGSNGPGSPQGRSSELESGGLESPDDLPSGYVSPSVAGN